jgi:hypothetical protein
LIIQRTSMPVPVRISVYLPYINLFCIAIT